MASPAQMQQLKITKSVLIPNLMFFHPKWLDEDFKNAAGSIIMVLRSTERSNLKRLLSQSLNLDRCVAKFGDLVQMLLKVDVKEFKQPKLEEVNSWRDFLIYLVCIIGEYQNWNPNFIQPDNQIKSK